MKDQHGVCSLVPAHSRLGEGKQRRHQMSNVGSYAYICTVF